MLKWILYFCTNSENIWIISFSGPKRMQISDSPKWTIWYKDCSCQYICKRNNLLQLNKYKHTA